MNDQANLESKDKIHSILTKITNEYLTEKNKQFKSNSLGQFVRTNAPKVINSLDFIDQDRFIVKGSVGQGNWAQIPWITILDKHVTTSTQQGYYLGYLFSEDMERVYLSFAQGITKASKEQLKHICEDIRSTIQTDRYLTSSPIHKDDAINIGSSSKGKSYEESTALYIEYDPNSLPSEADLQKDLSSMIEIYDDYVRVQSERVEENDTDHKIEWTDEKIIEHIHSYIKNQGFYYQLEDVKNLFLSLRTKPFVILSGISGTGKTKIIELFSESLGATEENKQFTLIPVRPDWSDGSDMLGYTDIRGVFQEGPLTSVIKEARLHKDHPYFVVLDEMNLARVEYYFSDFLSVMESRKWVDGKVQTLPIMSENQAGERLTIPPNLYIIGTVNMDETTHPFSKKVLDRANTIEWNDVHLDTLFFLKEDEGQQEQVNLPNQRVQSEYLRLKDAYSASNKETVEHVTTELVQINEILKPIQAHVGYRVRDEVCFYTIYSRYLMAEDEALDFQFYQKILPRLTASHGQAFQVLMNLFTYFTNHTYEEGLSSDQIEDILGQARFPRSGRKVYEMIRRGDLDGFTSFWSS
ncbi:MrcB family domain-containing protein [Halobacillus sp. K22]|uniref:MrcB family domain-containing protein n=1 Tax=Halobacillus sp. K22 TaxID=3457431 RepID=UPI003FCED490